MPENLRPRPPNGGWAAASDLYEEKLLRWKKDRGRRARPTNEENEEAEEEEEKLSEMGSEPESVEDDGRIVEDDNVGESWVWTRMFALIKKRNWLKKAKDRAIPLSAKQEESLKECDEDMEDIIVRTEEQLEEAKKQVGLILIAEIVEN